MEQQQFQESTSISVRITLHVPTVPYGSVEISASSSQVVGGVLDASAVAIYESSLYSALRDEVSRQVKELAEEFAAFDLVPRGVAQQDAGSDAVDDSVTTNAPARPSGSALYCESPVKPSNRKPGQWWVTPITHIACRDYTTRQGKKTKKFVTLDRRGEEVGAFYHNSPSYWMVKSRLSSEEIELEEEGGITGFHKPYYFVWEVEEEKRGDMYGVGVIGVFDTLEEAMDFGEEHERDKGAF